jgi:predicted O-linked N-acetylglucosamine transferase (SPINDLY family)
MKPVWALLNGHDRQRFEIVLFADNTDGTDLNWFQPGPHDHVHLTGALDNAQMIQLIREQSLDILVDLNGYSVPARLPVLAARLAPVGVAWFNMYATSGLPGMDWIVGDEFVIRPEEEPYYSERVKRLPQSYLSFAVGHEAPAVAPQPCLNGHVFTFGSLVSQYKITPAVLDAWSEILQLAPEAGLLLANRTLASPSNREYLLGQFERRGARSNQIELLKPAEHFAFLKYYDRIDVALDAFPYNGGTTTTEAIWQGVPVLTFEGDRWASRTSTSLLRNCHLGEFVASGVDAYVAAAIRWATDSGSHQRLAELRRAMRPCLLDSAVCRTSSMVQAMEDWYWEVCERYPQRHRVRHQTIRRRARHPVPRLLPRPGL